MALFNWGKTDEQTATPTEPNPSGVASSEIDAARNAARETVQSPARRRRGSREASPALAIDSSAVQQAALAAEIAKQLEACYDPKAWAALLASPGDAMAMLTGKERWKLSSDERATLGSTGSAAARTLLIQNPRTLAFLMVGSALFSAYVPRILEEVKDRKVKEAGNDTTKKS
jgi:hypothetical protein